MNQVSAVLIAGPTASGKSAFAVELARDIHGVVINADSMQVYADLRILSARPSEIEQAGVPHLLFGHVDAARNYSVGQWLIDARAAIEQARALGRTPLFVGGTGLYFKALTRGLSDIPAVPDDIRAQARRETQDLTPAEMHARLACVDPKTAARLRPSDPQRILRALEVFLATGASLSDFQGARAAPLLVAAECRKIFLDIERPLLKARIERRFAAMVANGAIEEARRLAARRLDPALPALRAHGVPGLIDYLEGRTSLEEAVARGVGDTRRYAKRQFTFARTQLPEFEWLDRTK